MQDGPDGAGRLSNGPEFALSFCPKASAIAVVSLERPGRNCSLRWLDHRVGPLAWAQTNRQPRGYVRYQFEDFMLDSDRRELARGAETIVIGPQVFDLLLHLVQSRAHVVTKDNLIDVVWGGRIVSDSTLTSHINAVRKAIGDTGDEQRLVRTIARKGYR